ncbi:hypothetical protein [Caldimonas sp. KR1-144]|uniref:hypothetical protein n=1 Tax=Caldimonas sp. KR1-144 TaxID=3400911 RepID=UPI003C0FF097
MPRPISAISVRLKVDVAGLEVSLSMPATATTQFAFYLFRGNQRVAQTEYGPRPSTRFAIPNIPGWYRAVAFVKNRATGAIERISGAPRRFPESGEYDPDQWRVPVHEAPTTATLRAVDGLHRFLGEGTTSLDFLLQDFERLAHAPAVLVCFNGAISKRQEKIGPFFAGTGIARRLGLPVICVADPTVTRARDIALAWYAGCDDHPHLSRTIGRHLSEVSAQMKRPLVLMGGSGGAFAALSVVRHVEGPAAVVACNPQTAIHRYYRQSVIRYFERAFPSIARSFRLEAPEQQTPEQLRDALATAGVFEELADTADSGKFRSIILQNAHDSHHVNRHLKPLMTAVGAEWSGSNSAHCGDEFGSWLGRWGEGHVAPPASILEPVVLKVVANESVRSIISGLEANHGIASPGANWT